MMSNVDLSNVIISGGALNKALVWDMFDSPFTDVSLFPYRGVCTKPP